MPDRPYPSIDQLQRCWPRYRDNFARKLGALNTYIESSTMAALSEAGHHRLAMSFSAPMAMLAAKPRRLTELAEQMAVSKQLCLQTLRPLEEAGYIQREADPHDGRAKILSLTDKGWQLVDDALREMGAMEARLQTLIGKAALKRLGQQLLVLHRSSIGGERIALPQAVPVVPAVLGGITRRTQQALMDATAAAGHRGLQMSFAQVLTAIDLHGSSIGAIAAHNAVTVPAISRSARELEHLGYVRRETDAGDRRSKKLLFTARGLQLICDAIAATERVEAQMREQLGEEAFADMATLLDRLNEKLELNETLLAPFDRAAAEQLLAAGAPSAAAAEKASRLEALLRSAAALDADPELAGEPLTKRDRRGQLQLHPEALRALAKLKLPGE